jgi:N-acetylglucosamine-6-phosphate deacetylase
MNTGFTDIHCHGGGGFSFSDPNPEHVEIALEMHRAHGTTTQIASRSNSDIEATN